MLVYGRSTEFTLFDRFTLTIHVRDSGNVVPDTSQCPLVSGTDVIPHPYPLVEVDFYISALGLSRITKSSHRPLHLNNTENWKFITHLIYVRTSDVDRKSDSKTYELVRKRHDPKRKKRYFIAKNFFRKLGPLSS